MACHTAFVKNGEPDADFGVFSWKGGGKSRLGTGEHRAHSERSQKSGANPLPLKRPRSLRIPTRAPGRRNAGVVV